MKLILLVGVPGSGKSTLATTQFAGMTRINQDELGSRDRCLKLCNEALARGESIVIDRCNQTPHQRKEWIKLGQIYQASIHCVYLEASPILASKRIFERKNHPTIKNYSIEKCKAIVQQFNNQMIIPSFDEGFDSILMIKVK